MTIFMRLKDGTEVTHYRVLTMNLYSEILVVVIMENSQKNEQVYNRDDIVELKVR